MHRWNISDTRKKEELKMVLYHEVPGFLTLNDLLTFRLAVANEQVTTLGERKVDYTNIILLAQFFKNTKIFYGWRKKQRLSPESYNRLKRAMETLNHVQMYRRSLSSDTTEFNIFRRNLDLFTGTKGIELVWLRLSDAAENECLTPRDISQFTNLMDLNLSHAKINRADVECFEGLSKLRILKLYGCNFIEDSEEGLSVLTDLTSLDISGTIYTEYTASASEEYLTSLTNLKILKLGQFKNRDIRGIEYIQGLTSITALDLLYNNALTNNNISTLSRLSELRSLNFEECSNITIDGIARLTTLEKLKSLTIYYETWFSREEGTSLKPLSKFKGLSKLSVTGQVYGVIEDDLERPGITNEALEDIGRMTQLEYLYLHANPLDYHCLSSLSSLTQLKFLSLTVDDNTEEMEAGFLKKIPNSVEKLELKMVREKTLTGLYGHPNLTYLEIINYADYDETVIPPNEMKRIQESIDELIQETPTLVSIIGLYGEKELAERREALQSKNQRSTCTLS